MAQITFYSSFDSDGHIFKTGGTYIGARDAASGTVNYIWNPIVIGQMVAELQYGSETSVPLHTQNPTRVGQRINGFSGTIQQVDCPLTKVGSPTGTAYLKVRKVSDDSELGTIGSIDVSTLTTVLTWYTFNSTPLEISTSTDIRICIEWTGGSYFNFIRAWRWTWADVTPFGSQTQFVDGEGWLDNASYDWAFKVSYATVFGIYRGYIFFDTSSLPDDAVITSATLKLYGEADYSVTDFDIIIQNGMPTYPSDPLVATDYDKSLYSGNGGSLATAGFVIGGFNTINLTATGIGWINKAGATKFCIRSSRDIDGNSPSGDEYIIISPEGDFPSELVVTYLPLPRSFGVIID